MNLDTQLHSMDRLSETIEVVCSIDKQNSKQTKQAKKFRTTLEFNAATLLDS